MRNIVLKENSMSKVIDKALISHLVQLEEDQQQKVLSYIKSLLAESLKASIQKGLKESDKGLGRPHREVMNEYRSKYKG